MRIIIFLLISIIPQFLFCQENKLQCFETLIDKTWVTEGKWGDDSPFKQEITYQYALDSTLIICNTKGFTDETRTKFGDRNHGIRKYDKSKDEIQFWEFDIFGGTTTGTVKQVDKNIVYEYDYGGTIVTELWEFVNDSTYNFQVGKYHEEKWEQIYLSSQFKGLQNKD